ncbi:MAG: L-seryl-tRNA(Sec) selenium transferase [Chloroflexi bacterium]|nr:L-seryl-tRNA(Sec) selenium transferase [Chloroflexota bacterium]
MADLRNIPSVERLLQTRLAAEIIAEFGRPLTLQAIRSVLGDVRRSAAGKPQTTIPQRADILERARTLLENWLEPTLQPVINATGVIIHTNLGRAPLSQATLAAMQAASHGYASLEFDLASGKRGSRLAHAEGLLQLLTGVEAAMVVNNNAAAVLLALSALANRKSVIIARSQLVEIGGGFRVPDVMKQSGARLVEVGATNKVHLRDYEQALAEHPAALVMHVHRSNFKIIGFTEEPELKDIVRLTHGRGIPFVDDLGSGALLDSSRYGLAHEPTVQESLAAGSDIVCFSGDKMLGGPQAGIITGKAELVDRMKKHPLARATRADKTRLAGLAATLTHYLKNEADHEVPIWRMIAFTPDQVRQTAEGWAVEIGQGEALPGESTVGGGSLPGENLPTFVLALDVKRPDQFLEKLRRQQPPVIARTENNRVLIDPRTILPEQEGALLVGLKNALGKKG